MELLDGYLASLGSRVGVGEVELKHRPLGPFAVAVQALDKLGDVVDRVGDLPLGPQGVRSNAVLAQLSGSSLP